MMDYNNIMLNRYMAQQEQADRLQEISEEIYYSDQGRKDFLEEIEPADMDDLAMALWLEAPRLKIPAGSMLEKVLARLDERFVAWCDKQAERQGE